MLSPAEGSHRRWSLPGVDFLPKRVAMGTRHSSRARQVGEESSVQEDGAPRLTEDDERALEVIRRQLDSEFPAPSRTGMAARRARWDAAAAEEAEQNRRPWNRARRRRMWIVVGTLLLACAMAAVAAALAAILYLRSADSPAVVDRERPRPSPEAVAPPSTTESSIPSFESPIPSSPTSRATKGSMAVDVSPGKPRPSASPIAPPAAVQAP